MRKPYIIGILIRDKTSPPVLAKLDAKEFCYPYHNFRGININDIGLKSSILFKGGVLWISGRTVGSDSVAGSLSHTICSPSSVCASTRWPAIPGRGDEEHALVAVETAVRHEDVGVGIESEEIAATNRCAQGHQRVYPLPRQRKGDNLPALLLQRPTEKCSDKTVRSRHECPHVILPFVR